MPVTAAMQTPLVEPPGVILARGVCRGLAAAGQAALTEVPLANGRRADVMALDDGGTITIVEVKSCIEDFRSDRKWGDYRGFCDALYFAVPQSFPHELIPEDCGLMVADGFDAVVVRRAPVVALVAARRKAVLMRFARLAALRLHRLTDPSLGLDR